MWTLDTRIELTPLGSYVANLHAQNRRLADRTYPGLDSTDPRTCKEAETAVDASARLMGSLQDELAEVGAWPIKTEPTCQEEGCDAPACSHGWCADHDPFADDEPIAAGPRFHPHICAGCNIGNLYGPPSCLDAGCPNPMKLNPPTDEEWKRFHEQDAEARNFSDGPSEMLRGA